MNINTVNVIDKGLKCLSDNIGAKETEIFIATLLRERFDYTEWRELFVDKIDTFEKLDEFVENSYSRPIFKSDSIEIM